MHRIFSAFILLVISSSLFGQNPVAVISLSKTSGISPTSLTFDGTASISPGSSIVSHTWNFDEGSTSTLPSGTFTFDTVGTFQIQLIVEDLTGARDTSEISFDSYGPGIWLDLGDNPDKRLENGYVEVGDKFYLIGGINGSSNVLVFDPLTLTWTANNPVPIQFHHFQPVVKDGLVYITSTWVSPNPFNDSNDSIYIYNPLNDSWTTGREVPVSRKRGSAGSVLYDGKIYISCGNEGGHGGHSSVKKWLDVYDPATGAWDSLPDAPIERDHIYATVINDKMYMAAGRQSDNNNWLSSVVLQIDVYDFATNTWSTNTKDLPTGRSGSPLATLDGKLVVLGGETNQNDSHEEMEVYDPITDQWIRYTDMDPASHGTNAIVNNGVIWVAGGSEKKGVSNQTSENKLFFSNGTATPATPILTPVTASSLSADPTVDFSTTVVGDSGYATIVLRSTLGSQGIIITDFNLNANASLFELIHPFVMPIVVAPGDSATIQVKYKPVATGTITGNVEIVHKGMNATQLVNFGSVAPQAAFTVSNGGNPSQINLDGTGSSDIDGTLVSYSWDFGDGNTGTGPTPMHAYAVGGTYQVRLIITDNAGLTDTTTESVMVNTVFPVELLDFRASVSGNDASLHWETATEVNSDVFIIEEILTGNVFQEKGRVDAAGNSVQPLSYSFVLTALSKGKHTFRLIARDQDGSSAYSNQVEINLTGAPYSLAISPNPVSDRATISIKLGEPTRIELELFTIDGRSLGSLLSQDLEAGSHDITLDLSNRPSGIYFVKDGYGTLYEVLKQ